MSKNMTIEKMEEPGHSPYFNSVKTLFSFIAACMFITLLCWSERLLSYRLEHIKYERNRHRFRTILIRTFGYSMATIFRLFYMLITMTMNSQLFIIVVVGLTTGQLITEYLRSTSTYASKHGILGIHSPTSLSNKDDDDIPSATTLGNESTSDKIGGYTEVESRDFDEDKQEEKAKKKRNLDSFLEEIKRLVNEERVCKIWSYSKCKDWPRTQEEKDRNRNLLNEGGRSPSNGLPFNAQMVHANNYATVPHLGRL
ncbi:1469_t:CDS:2, partial [Scutellospora calospora]